MKLFLKFLIFIPAAVLMFIIDVPPQTQSQPQFPYFQLVSEAHAVLGVRRRSMRRGVAVGESMAHSQQQAAPAPQQAAPAPQQAAPAPQQAAMPAGALPLGAIVSPLPAGCTGVQVGGVEYQHCGVDYYRTAFQGGNVVYVTSKPN